VGLAAWSASTAPASPWGWWVADGCLLAALGLVGVALVRWWRCERAMARSVRLPHGPAFAVLAAGALMLAVFTGLCLLR
jgi:uncharacterized membrane protein YidH (DUF202 family)